MAHTSTSARNFTAKLSQKEQRHRMPLCHCLLEMTCLCRAIGKCPKASSIRRPLLLCAAMRHLPPPKEEEEEEEKEGEIGGGGGEGG